MFFFGLGWDVACILDVEEWHAGRFFWEEEVGFVDIGGFRAWLGGGFHEVMTWMYSVAYWILLLFPQAWSDVVVRFTDMCSHEAGLLE